MRTSAPTVLTWPAVLILVAWGMAELAGLRESTALLSRVDLVLHPGDVLVLGIFLIAYLLAVLVAPVLLIGAALRIVLSRLIERQRAPAKVVS